MTSYDPENIFAKILRGDLPCEKLYEDQNTIAIMDVMPQADGHVLVLPKTPSRNMLDIAEPDIAPLFNTVQRLARAVKQAFAADGVTIQQFNEIAGGQSVFHTHVHVIPRFDGVALRPHTGTMADADELTKLAAKIRQAL